MSEVHFMDHDPDDSVVVTYLGREVRGYVVELLGDEVRVVMHDPETDTYTDRWFYTDEVSIPEARVAARSV